MLDDAQDLIDSLDGQDILVRRTAPGRYVNRKWEEGAATTFTISGSVQPVSQDERLLLPEGDEDKEAVRIYSAVPLLKSSEKDNQSPDQITWGGKDYLISEVQVWVGGVYKSIAASRDAGRQTNG